jgi:hypothetical protein
MTDIASSFTEPEEPYTELLSWYQYDSLGDKPPRTIRLLKIDHDCADGVHYGSDGRGDFHKSDLCQNNCCKEFNARMPSLTLHQTCLDTSPEYEAISYAWGNAALVQQVAFGSKVLRVTQSCYDLLRILRKRDSSRCGDRACSTLAQHYWIDAICINQGFQEDRGKQENSRRERSHQVAMMATIYEKANKVIVWPGHVDAGDRLDILRDALRDNLLRGKLEKECLSVIY